ncbi:MAG: FtsW/RodA/SpoVE family cell cycle protein, partial [Clostridia bacterium]|nr:FtsW/RodA/SpoVE family cell cycle protein [Clostridia bacterium]
ILLLSLGSVMVFSASYPNAQTFKDNGMYYIYRHLLFVAAGAVFMAVLTWLPYTVYRAGAIPLSVVSVALLLLVFVMGAARGVAQRWIVLGGNLTLQPSEVAKISLILLLAWYIDKHSDTIYGLGNKGKLLHGIIMPGLIMFGFCGLVLIEKHLSGTVILAMIGLCIIFLSGASVPKMLLWYGIPAVVGGGGFILMNSYALERIKTYLDSDADVLDELWQTTQGLYAIGNGGLLGTGLGKSNLKYNYVSEAQNDFIFSIWCEETGFVGALLLLVLYGLFIWRGMKIARRAPDTFSSLTAFGITCQVGIQALLNILVVTDMIFNTGVALPFFSYGGSATVVLMGEMGILLSISKHSYQKKI